MGIYTWRQTPYCEWQSHAFVRGVRRSGHAPPIFCKKKWCNLVRFRVYFAAIWQKKKCSFFYTKVIDIVLYIGVLEHTPQNVCLLCNLVRLGIYFDYI